MDLSDLIARNAAFTPDKPALVFEGQALSYRHSTARHAGEDQKIDRRESRDGEIQRQRIEGRLKKPGRVKGDDGSFREHFGETRDDRIREFHEMNDTPVVGLWEGGILRVEGGAVFLSGAGARIFRKGQEPEDVGPGARLDDLLAG